MSMVVKLVLLLKTKSEENVKDKYQVLLQENGYETVQVNTLDFEYINIDRLQNSLRQPNDFSGIVFSSPRCVNAAKLALINESVNEEWHKKYNYVVGETTYDIAFKELGLKCLGKESGNANNLADIMNEKSYEKPFLYPHGNLKMDILKKRLEKSNLYEICVYDTIANNKLEEELKEATNNFRTVPEYIVFFSPSGINSSLKYLQNFPLQDIKFIAIGPTTEKAMKDNNIKIFGTCNRPTPEDLIAVITNKNHIQ